MQADENPDDLFQIGCIGLIKAINNFNTELEVKFSTYAVPMIIGEIRRYMRDNNSIRVSRSLRDTAYKAIYARETYMKKNQKEPTVQEIATGDWHIQRGYCVCAGCNPGTYESAGTGL